MHRFLSPDLLALRDTVRRFAEREVLPRAAAIDREDRFDRGLYRAMAALGLFGVALPEAAGGSGQGAMGACVAMEELARCSGAVANAFAIPVEAALFLHQHGHAGQRATDPRHPGRRRHPRHRRQRAGPRLRRGRHAQHRPTRRRRLGAERHQGLGDAGRRGGRVDGVRPHRGGGRPQGDQLLPAGRRAPRRCCAARRRTCSACTGWRTARSCWTACAPRRTRWSGRRTAPSRWRWRTSTSAGC